MIDEFFFEDELRLDFLVQFFDRLFCVFIFISPSVLIFIVFLQDKLVVYKVLMPE